MPGSAVWPDFILVNRKYLEKNGPDPIQLSSTMPMTGNSFVIPDEEATIWSAPRGHFAVYKLALDAGLRFAVTNLLTKC